MIQFCRVIQPFCCQATNFFNWVAICKPSTQNSRPSGAKLPLGLSDVRVQAKPTSIEILHQGFDDVQRGMGRFVAWLISWKLGMSNIAVLVVCY